MEQRQRCDLALSIGRDLRFVDIDVNAITAERSKRDFVDAIPIKIPRRQYVGWRLDLLRNESRSGVEESLVQIIDVGSRENINARDAAPKCNEGKIVKPIAGKICFGDAVLRYKCTAQIVGKCLTELSRRVLVM